MPLSAAEIAQRLARMAPALCAELFANGRREGGEFKVGSVAGERGASLSIRLFGSRAGVWSDFATGEGGDALNLVAATLFRGDVGAAMRWSCRWLGLGDGAPAPPTQPAKPAPAMAPAREDNEAARREAALHIFLAARPVLAGTPADEYLIARGIALAALGRQPRALRFHPGLWNTEARRHFPAMVAAVSNAAGEHVATHRTWLAQDAAGVWRKAPLRAAKKTLGTYAGGCIRLWRGASRKLLAEAQDGETVVIAEGIETALSVAIACPELRILAAVSLGNMGKIELPAAVRVVVIAADDDGANDPARRGLAAAVQHFSASGRRVHVAWPPGGLGDFNDALRAEGLR